MNIVVAFTAVVVQRSNALIIRIIVVDRMLLVGVAIEVVAIPTTAECVRTDQRGCGGGRQSLRLSLQTLKLLLLLLLLQLMHL